MFGEGSVYMATRLASSTILGVRFANAAVKDVVGYMQQHGGLLVVPAAPALAQIDRLAGYRRSLLGADLAIADSIYMVGIWKLLTGKTIRRISGLLYTRALISELVRLPQRNSYWVMPSADSSLLNHAALTTLGLPIERDYIYVAPHYRGTIIDPMLILELERQRPSDVVIALGGLVQEQLGLYLKESLTYKPAIHCIGAAIAFISGDQIKIPMWADTLGLGWLFRVWSNPRTYGQRYLSAFRLAGQMYRYGSEAPPFTGES
jgi:N-acetylglucosaminyldiphosphoundecaprenol N-acetyl-beta-D-mannosaminyltransferase